MKKILIILLTIHCSLLTHAQDMTALINRVKTKLEKVNDYTADAVLKTDVAFIKAPISKVKMYYKKPDKFRMKKDGGISVLPKGGISINVSSIADMNNFVALSAGEAVVDGVTTKVVKVLPNDQNSDVVLSTLYIDEPNLLVRKVITTTRENGTYEMNMTYGKYADFGLPDKVLFSFNAKDYKLPKGITMDFDEGTKTSDMNKLKDKKGKVEIIYKSYIINKGLDDAVFKQ